MVGWNSYRYKCIRTCMHVYTNIHAYMYVYQWVCVCSIAPKATSGTTIFTGNLWGHVQPSWISSLLWVALQRFFYLIAFVWANHFRTSDLSWNCVCLSALFFALKTKWRQLSASPGLMLDFQWSFWERCLTEANHAEYFLFFRICFCCVWPSRWRNSLISQSIEIRTSAKGTHDASVVLPIHAGLLKAIIHEGQSSNATRESVLVVVALPWALVSRFTQLFLQQRQRHLVGCRELIDGDHLLWHTSAPAAPAGHSPCVCLTVAHSLHRSFCVPVPSRGTVGGNGLHLVAF